MVWMQSYSNTVTDIFYRQMKPMVESGFYLYRPATVVFNWVGRRCISKTTAKEISEEHPTQKEFQRLKGLGEMDWQELRSTTMHVD